MGQVYDLSNQGKIIAAKALGSFPFIVVFVESSDGDIVTFAGGSFVFPDRVLTTVENGGAGRLNVVALGC